MGDGEKTKKPYAQEPKAHGEATPSPKTVLTDASEERARILQEIATACGDWVWQVDSEGVYTFCSPEVQGILGYTPGEIIGKNFLDFISQCPADRERQSFSALFSKDTHKGMPILNMEKRVVHKDGSEVFLLSVALPLLDEKGGISGYGGVDRDISRYKHLEETLREREEILRACVNATQDLIYVKDEDLKYLIINKRFCEVLGRTEEEVVGKRASELFPSAIAKTFEEISRGVLASESDAVTELAIDDKIYETRKVPVRIRSKTAIAGSKRDITQRKKSEEAAKKAEEACVREKIRFQALCENAPFGLMLVNQGDKVKYINPRFQELFGYAIDELPDGKTWFRRAFPNAHYRHEVIESWMKSLEQKAPAKTEPWSVSVTCKDGTEKIVNLVPVRIGASEFMVSCEDVTQLKSHEKQLMYFSSNDSLTGLPNRSSMEKTLAAAIDRSKQGRARGGRGALLLLDIDDFKRINNEFGHTAGDEVLIAFAKALKSILRSGDSAYRFGGDQFAVVFKGISLAEAQLAARRIQKSMNEYRFPLEYNGVRLDIAMGLVQIDGRMDVVTLLSDAAKAVHKAKVTGRNQLTVHEFTVTIVPGTGKA